MRWSGFQGAPGYSIFHFRDFGAPEGWTPTNTEAEGCIARVDAFAEGLKSLIPYGTSLNVLNEVEVIEDTDGSLVNLLTGTPAAPHNSTQSLGQTFAGPVGAVINWKTSSVRKGRRIGGRTFLVPLGSSVYEQNGTLSSGAITTISTAATAFIADGTTGDLGVYARPTRTKNPDGTVTETPDGEWATVKSFTVPDMAAVLRSRRD